MKPNAHSVKEVVGTPRQPVAQLVANDFCEHNSNAGAANAHPEQPSHQGGRKNHPASRMDSYNGDEVAGGGSDCDALRLMFKKSQGFQQSAAVWLPDEGRWYSAMRVAVVRKNYKSPEERK